MAASEKALWLLSPRVLNLYLSGFVAAWVLLFGNPLQHFENRWFDQSLRLRLALGLAPPVDPRIVHLDITEEDLATAGTLEAEYESTARLIREGLELGAEILALDIIYVRGNQKIAQPILEAAGDKRRVVFAEGFQPQRVRSFPFLPDAPDPSGIINLQSNRDGVYRRYDFVHFSDNGPGPSLALAAYLALKGIRWPQDIRFPHSKTVGWEELSPEGSKLLSREWRMKDKPLLDFRSGWTAGGPAAFPHLTLQELHRLYEASRGSGKPGPLAGKILFVANVAAGIGDFGSTPFGPYQPLVQLHATALNDLLQSSSHFVLPRWLNVLVLLPLLAMALGATRCRSKWSLGLAWLAGSFLLLSVGTAAVFFTHGVLPTVLALSVWSIALLMELIRRHTVELLERIKLETTMGYYFSPNVLKRVLANPGSMEPQQVELTVLLTDIRNFTPISERLGPRDTFALCNRVFEAQTQAVTAEDGCLEHFLGDQFLSYWGAPEPQADSADRALRAAYVLLSSMARLRPQLPQSIQDLFGYGLALHAGTAMIGNKGSLQRMDYGLLGDLINSAARVESLTKYYHLPFLITRELHNKLSKPPTARHVDTVLPVGKSTPLELWEIKHPYTPPDFDALAQDYAKAMSPYRQGDFATAHPLFLRLAKERKDPASQLMATRCEEFLAHPPLNWKGVYQFASK